MKFRVSFLATVLVCTSTHAVTIRDALTSAYKNNQDLLATRQAVIANHEKIVQAKSGFRPKIDAKATNTFVNSRSKIDSDGLHRRGSKNDKNGSISISQNLFRGFSDIAKVAQTEHDILSMWAQLKTKEQDTFLSVIKAYLDLYAKYAAVEVYKANLVFVQKQYEAASTKREIGEETKTQESLAEAKCAETQSKLESSLADLEAAKATFEQLTGLAAPEYVDHPKEQLETPESMELLQDVALKNNPKITQAIEDLASAKQSKRSVTGQLLPSIDLQASSSRDINKNKTAINSLGYSNTPTTTSVNNQVAVSLSVPLYDQGVTRSQRREATETIIGKRIGFEKVRQEIIQACKQAYRAYIAAKTNMETSAKQVKAQEVAVDGTTQEMEVGTKILLDVLNAQTQLLQARLDQINTIQQYCYYLYQMLSLQGRLTAEDLQLPVEIFHIEQRYDDIKNHI